MYILYLYFLFICIFFFFLELIYSVDIADEEPHFVGYSVVNHYLLTYLLTYLLGEDTILASPTHWKRDCILYVFIRGHAKVYCS